jgi:hypothetical protein
MTALFLVSTCARSSDVRTLGRDLCRSPSIASTDVGLTILWNQPSAAAAYPLVEQDAVYDETADTREEDRGSVGAEVFTLMEAPLRFRAIVGHA